MDKLITSILSKLLEISEEHLINQNSFWELGLNSYLSVEFIELLNKRTGLNLGIEVIFDYPGIKELSSYIGDVHGHSYVSNDEQGNTSNFEMLLKVIQETFLTLVGKDNESISPETGLFEVGIDSVVAVELVETLNRKLGMDLGVEVVFDYPSFQELAMYIASEHSDSVHRVVEQVAVTAAQDIRSAQSSTDEIKSSDIAIIGISGKFADSTDVEMYWEKLRNGISSIKEIKRNGWDSNYFESDASVPNKSLSKWGGLLDSVSSFDPLFFNISPLEAERMDPQQRIFLEESYKAFEDAGYSEEELSGKKVGVFVGARTSDYKDNTLRHEQITSQTFLGNDMAILAARISYFLNLKGPSLALDTACSSSLVAIHMACDSIRRGESEMALAGGVFTIPSPEFLVMTSKTNMLSPDGQCKTFDNDANGIVIGEGCGAIILKRLDQAVEAGDFIYGVIKGSAINQDGKTKGITAPSMLSQKALLTEAYASAGISPESMTYIEAHGTGTKLGDPIEFKALAESFKSSTNQKEYCYLGSHKPNIGHSIMSAGIAGVIKILMALKYKEIPPTISLSRVNEHIDLASSPFRINTQVEKWRVPHGTPRRAGISSFGFSGTNCHVILEEYQEQNIPKFADPAGVLYPFPVSAVTEEALERKLVDLADWLKNSTDHSLKDISYTLSMGRRHFTSRVFFVASDKEELIKAISQVIQNCKMKSIQQDIGQISTFEHYSTSQILLEMGRRYLGGESIQWTEFFDSNSCRRIPLPTYPFARTEYWHSSTATSAAYTQQKSSGYVHPLVQTNLSTSSKKLYKTILTGEEFYLKDHVIHDNKILPGVACLEMANIAFKQALEIGDVKEQIKISDVVWIRPIIIEEQPVTIFVTFNELANDTVTNFEIYSEDSNSLTPVVHCQGRIGITDALERPHMEIDTLLKECSQSIIKENQCYEDYKGMGITYGPSHRGIRNIYIGKDQTVSELKIPSCIEGTIVDYDLHPALMDAAFQGGLGFQDSTNGIPSLPFALQELIIYGKFTENMWALVSLNKQGKPTEDLKKFNVHLLDSFGNLAAKVTGLITRNFERKTEHQSVLEVSSRETLMFVSEWEEDVVLHDDSSDTDNEHILFLCEPGNTLDQQELHRLIDNNTSIISLQYQGDLMERYLQTSQSIFTKIRNIIDSKPKKKVWIQVMVFSAEHHFVYRSILGLLKTASQENTKLLGQLIEINQSASVEEMAEAVNRSRVGRFRDHVRIQGQRRWFTNWKECSMQSQRTNDIWKDKGKYLLVGGAGRLSMEIARDITRSVKSPLLILVGRSSLNDKKKQELTALSDMGAEIIYKEVDVTRKEEVEILISDIDQSYQNIDGIIFNAGVIQDNLIMNKSLTEFQRVMSPKVDGLFYLDEATKHYRLDFFLLSSSIAGSLGNAGQADYALANAFLDVYSDYRNRMVHLRERTGKTLSINWPLWADGGMQISDAHRELVQKKTGMIPMDTASGIRALKEIYNMDGYSNVMVLHGQADIIRKQLQYVVEPSTSDNNMIHRTEEKFSTEKLQNEISKIIGELLKLKRESIDPNTELVNYGFDSITFTELSNRINSTYQLTLTPVVFYEYASLHAFVQYLANEYKEKLSPYFKIRNREPFAPAAIETDKSERNKNSYSEKIEISHTVDKPNSDLMAIVGISGSFPGAEKAEILWENLINGVNAITSVPDDRIVKDREAMQWGGFIEGVDEFDSLFFGISPREAELMDPQQRLLLKHVWQAIEDMGAPVSQFSSNPTGVFVAVAPGVHHQIDYESPMAMTSVTPSMIPNRISYAFNLQGPSEYYETACSSTFVALHRAIQSIRNHECEQAVVGAVNLLLLSDYFTGFDAMGYLSNDGNCKPFQQGAAGYVRSEGVGAFIIKPLNKAIQDRDHIYSVVKGTGVSHGGRGASMTAPSVAGMRSAMVQAYRQANVDPNTVTYIEAHGIASPIGDALEINALISANKELRAFSDSTEQEEVIPCYISSLKSNIGHGEVASGLSELFKVLYAMKYGIIPGITGFETINDHINLSGSRYQMADENRQWPRLRTKDGKILPRRASINSYGFGGVNAHIVLEEYIDEEEVSTTALFDEDPQIAVFSAKTKEQLRKVMVQTRDYLKENPGVDFNRLIYTLQVGREAMECRAGFVVQHIADIITAIEEYLENNSSENERVDQGEEHVQFLLSGSTGRMFTQALMHDKDWEKILILWRMGIEINWEEFVDVKRKRVSLPTYPFLRRKVAHAARVEQNDSLDESFIEPTGQVSIHEGLKQHIIDQIADLLGFPSNELPIHSTMSSLGFTSIQAVTLRQYVLRDYGIDVPLLTINEHSKVEDLADYLSELCSVERKDSVVTMMPVIASKPEEKYLPFPLTDIQESFLLGRKLKIGGDWVGAHIYYEVEMKNLDIYNLNQSWNKLVTHHEMLRTVILDNGTQQVLEEVNPYVFKVLDLRRGSEEEASNALSNLRAKISHKVYEPQQWPLFDIRITVLPSGKAVIHFSIDELIIDASGIYLLLSQWKQLYENRDLLLPSLDVSFRDYVLALKEFETSERTQTELAYWMKELNHVPSGPLEKFRISRTEKSMEMFYRTRLSGSLNTEEWERVKQMASKWNVSTTAFILSVFSEVLRVWNEDIPFTIVLTYFNKLPIHEQVNSLIGPFISTSLYTVHSRNDINDSFGNIVIKNQKKLWANLDHGTVSGIKVLRELKNHHNPSNHLFFPVVFTSLINNEEKARGATQGSFSDSICHMVNQTPQVYLDHQVYVEGEELKFTWDIAEDCYEPNVMKQIFDHYCTVLKYISSNGTSEELPQFLNIPHVDPLKENLEQFEDNKNIVPIDVDIQEKYKSFPLTDIQQSYLFGRKQYSGIGGNSCLYYTEIETKNLNAFELERAWNKLIHIHEMLRTRIQPDGTQVTMKIKDEYVLDVLDIRESTEIEQQQLLAQVKQDMFEHVFQLEQWPYFDLRVTWINDNLYRIHFSIDMLVADGNSIQLLLKQLVYYYLHSNQAPVHAGYLFRDHIMEIQEYRRTNEYKNMLKYWEGKFQKMPPGPKLPETPFGYRTNSSKYDHFKGILKDWDKLKHHSMEMGISPNIILLAAYMEVLSIFSVSDDFSVVIPCWERPLKHVKINEIVGDFTSMSWVSYRSNQLTFLDKVKSYQQEVEDDLKHQSASAMAALRKKALQSKGSFSFPVVFSNLTTVQQDDANEFNVLETLTKTPQIFMDNISEERDGILNYHWDVVRGIYSHNVIIKMFDLYSELLNSLANSLDSWNYHDFKHLLHEEVL
ncbi:SDR family NAD(P)-dependent oxidoreductase [Paenibacillus taichungensis]|uniref:SDR family NAD(P)-dependent oxidoreductase n=1 Tax=Paenibacillus taichungensis TaxID=484184 RepID=UPI0038D0C419